MKIVDVETRLLNTPLTEPLGGSAARPPQTYRRLLAVTVHGENGQVGYGESYGTPEAVAAIVRETLAPRVIGRDVRNVELLWHDCLRAIGYHGPSGVAMEALSGLDLALWDLLGKDLKVPVSVLLGGYRAEVSVYAASVYLDEPARMAEVARKFVEAGYPAVKVKIGLDPENDLAAVEAVRQAIGPRVRMMVDANGAYDRRTAIRVGRTLDRLGAVWLEEPVGTQDLDGYAQVGAALDVPIAGGEGHYTRYAFRDLVVKGNLDILQPDFTRCGGLGEGKAIAALASAFGRSVSPHSWSSVFGLAASIQFAAAVPAVRIVEYDAHPNPLKSALIGNQLAAHHGQVRVPTGPGFGLDLDLRAWDRWTIPIG